MHLKVFTRVQESQLQTRAITLEWHPSCRYAAAWLNVYKTSNYLNIYETVFNFWTELGLEPRLVNFVTRMSWTTDPLSQIHSLVIHYT